MDRYKLEYRVRGLVVQDGTVQESPRHMVEVYLTLAYPRQAPQCRMLSPIFHPNIAPHAICIGDHWSAGEPLPALLVRIAEMICFQSYNVKSPLNGDAARWAEEHAAELPLERTDYSKLVTDPGPLEAAGDTAIPVSPVPASPFTGGFPSEPPSGVTSPDAPPVVHPLPSRNREVVCAGCGATLSAAPERAGRWVRCPLCGRMFSMDL